VALSLNLGGHPLLDADEGRNGEVGREMAATNDYVMPRLDTLPYVDKPIVYFAAEAAAMEVLGPTETAARLPALLFTLLTAALVAWFARRELGAGAAWLSAIVLLSMPLTIGFAHMVIFDSALSFFITAALMAFYYACHPEASVGVQGSAPPPVALANAKVGRHWATLAWLAIGFGVITKGPVAIALPLFVAIPYAIKRRRFGALWSWGGLAAFAVVIAPWVWGVTQVVPDFLHYVLVTETMQRMATKALKRTGPPWYFIPFIVGGALPWSIVAGGELVARLRSRRGRTATSKEQEKVAPPPALLARDPELYLILWVLIPFIFFSISQSKRPQYVLPLMPAIALLAARATRGVKAAAITVMTLGVLLLAALEFAHLRGEYVAAARTTALGLGIACLAGGAVALFAKRRDLAFVALSLPMLALPLLANPMMNALAVRRSTKELAAQLAPYVRENTEVAGIEAFTGSMAFYLRRPVAIYTPDAEETTSNYLIRHYAQFAGAAGSPIRRMEDLPRALADRTTPRIWIVRNDDATNRARVEASGAALVASGAHFVAYTMRR
jgi:4-amino-4-deoxy-L-arabinose transferase-like glycosyltransferase